MIEIHYGKYIRNDADEQTKPEVGDKTETSGETVERKLKRLKRFKRCWWAHLDSNQGPTGYEPVALTN
jgi:hypothetical protein